MKISSSYGLVTFGAVVLSFFYRLLLPLGDEPDFLYQVERFFFATVSLREESSLYASRCLNDEIISTQNLSFNKCSLIMVDGFIFAILNLFPILFLSLLFVMLGIERNAKSNNFKFHAIRVSLLSATFPGPLYYSNLISNESILYFLSLLAVILIRSRLSIAILFFILLADRGNFSVLITFYFIFWFLCYTRKPILLFLLMLAVILTFYYYRPEVVSVIAAFGFFPNAESYLKDYLSEGGMYYYVVDKYPIYLRYLQLLVTTAFYTPHGIAPYGLYIFYFVIGLFLLSATILVRPGSISKTFHVLIKTPLLSERNLSYFYYLKNGVVASIVTVSIFIVLFPSHTNAKYYIFMFPFFLGWLYLLFGTKIVLTVSIFSNIVVLSYLLDLYF